LEFRSDDSVERGVKLVDLLDQLEESALPEEEVKGDKGESP